MAFRNGSNTESMDIQTNTRLFMTVIYVSTMLEMTVNSVRRAPKSNSVYGTDT